MISCGAAVNENRLRSMASPRYTPPVNTARSQGLPRRTASLESMDVSLPEDVNPLTLYLRRSGSSLSHNSLLHVGTSTASTPCSAQRRMASSAGSRQTVLIHTFGNDDSTPPSDDRHAIAAANAKCFFILELFDNDGQSLGLHKRYNAVLDANAPLSGESRRLKRRETRDTACRREERKPRLLVSGKIFCCH